VTPLAANRLYSSTLLLAALGFFAVLALDITLPAVVLTLMAALRWAVLASDDIAPKLISMKGQAA
jgi:hypothetical protein